MIPNGAYRFGTDFEAMRRLSRWLKASRRPITYYDLVRARHLTQAEAEVDARARRAIAADWEAIYLSSTVHPLAPEATASERLWCLRDALRIAELHVKRADPDKYADLADLRDAIGCLLLFEQSGSTEKLVEIAAKLDARRRAFPIPIAPASASQAKREAA